MYSLTDQKILKNVGAIHELPLHFLCPTQLKTAISSARRCTSYFLLDLNDSELRTTLIELNAIAKPAIVGLREMPKLG